MRQAGKPNNSVIFWPGRATHGCVENHPATGFEAESLLGLVAAYDFSGPAPVHDQKGFLPDLSWTLSLAPQANSKAVFLDGTAWFTSGAPIAGFVKVFRASGFLTDCEMRGFEGIIQAPLKPKPSSCWLPGRRANT